MANSDEECDIRPGTVTPKKLPKQSGGGGHEFVTELPETGDEGVEYVLMDDFSDCSTYRGTFVWNEDCGGWIQTSGSGGGAVERYTFEQTATGWRAKRNNTVIFTYVDKDTIDSYENTADGFQITRNGVVIFTHTDGGGGDCKEYTITATTDGWVFKEDGVTKFTYTEPANDPSDGTYFTSGTLTTAITGTTTVAASSVTGLTLADVVIGETLIYDEAGTVGRVTAVSGTNLTVETITTAPGERRGTRLGAVDDYTDLPATCAAAVALGWQTPLAGDFAYVREDTSHDSHLTEWVISSIDGSCNITWAYSHTLNAGNYVLDIYKYGDYPSGSPIPKNPDGSVTLPKDEDTKYDFETVMDGTTVKGWRVKDHDSGTVLYTYTDQNDNDTYTFEDVTVSGNVVGWRVKDKSGTVIYTYTDLNDKSDGTYFTSVTLDTDITDQTTVAASTVTGLTLSDVVIGETLIYDGDGTVGVVTAVSGTNLTVDTITVSGSGDASSYVYKTTGTFDTTVDNTTNVNLSTLTDASGNTPTASDIIIGKTLAWDDDGTVALAVAISGSSVTFKTMTLSGSGGGGSYYVDPRGDELLSIYASLDSNQSLATVNTNVAMKKRSGTIEQPSVGLFRIPAGVRVEMKFTHASSASQGDIIFGWYNATDSVWITDRNSTDGLKEYCPYSQTPSANGYQMGGTYVIQWTNETGHTVDIALRVKSVSSAMNLRDDYSGLSITEIGRVVDPVKYLDNSKGLQDTPVGNIISYMGNNVPKHYLACDGTVYNIGDYPALEAHFITEFGRVNYFGGNGTTTWAVPDLKGEFLRGTGTNSHAKNGNGADVGVHQNATQISGLNADNNGGIYATTTADASNSFGQKNNGSGTTLHAEEDYAEAAIYNKYRSTGGAKNTNPNNTDGAYTTRPTNTSVKYCIKYESTMQVILGNEQYKVEASITKGASKTWDKNGGNNGGWVGLLTALHGDSSLIDSSKNYFVAPVDGWYDLHGMVYMSTKNSNATAWIWFFDLDDDNRKIVQTNFTPRNAGNVLYDGKFDSMQCSGTVYIPKGHRIQVGVWTSSGDETWTNNRATMTLLTSSVDINEVNLIAADDVYSTDEQLVGSFLGKPLYKKTYELPSGLSLSNTSWTNSGIAVPSDLDKLIKVEGQAAQGRATTNNGAFAISGHCDNGVANYQLLAARDGNSATIFYFTAYYTKTSDAANSAPNKNSLLLTRPDLWTPGTEYDFGGGLYGKRLKGTMTGINLRGGNLTICSSVATTAQVKSKGGMVDMSGTAGTNWYDINGGWFSGASGADYFSPLATNTSNTLRFHCANNQGITSGNIQYDVWFTYTKA